MRIDLDARAASAQAVVPRFVELQHRTEGWVRIDLPGQAREDGVVVLATTDLPTGRYEAVRLVYLVPRARDGASAPTSWVPAEALLLQAFCLGAADPRSSILLRVGPSGRDVVPTRITLEAPLCVEDRDLRW